MIDIISDKDLRALINDNYLADRWLHFNMWCGDDQRDIFECVFASIDGDDQKKIFDEAVLSYFEADDSLRSTYSKLIGVSEALPAYMELLLEAQINKAMHHLKQIRDEENRG